MEISDQYYRESLSEHLMKIEKPLIISPAENKNKKTQIQINALL
jgi:hypothetical protein